jgi:hypothetical protein
MTKENSSLPNALLSLQILIITIINVILHLLTCSAKQPLVSHRVSPNTNNKNNKTTKGLNKTSAKTKKID